MRPRRQQSCRVNLEARRGHVPPLRLGRRGGHSCNSPRLRSRERSVRRTSPLTGLPLVTHTFVRCHPSMCLDHPLRLYCVPEISPITAAANMVLRLSLCSHHTCSHTCIAVLAMAANSSNTSRNALHVPVAERFWASIRRKEVHQPSTIKVDWSRPGLPAWPAWLPPPRAYQPPAVELDWSPPGVPPPYVWPVRRPQARAEEPSLDWSIKGLPALAGNTRNQGVRKRVRQPPELCFDWSQRGRPDLGSAPYYHLLSPCLPATQAVQLCAHH